LLLVALVALEPRMVVAAVVAAELVVLELKLVSQSQYLHIQSQ